MTTDATYHLSEDQIQKILRGVTIPSPPQVMADLQMEMASPNPDLNAMANLIAGDVGLAGGVLKIVNSPVFGGRGTISSITRAVMFLGMDTVMGIVNALCLRNSMLAGHGSSDELMAVMNRFWDSAIDVAQACVLVAQKLRLPVQDQVYTLGLFHNVAIPLLMQKHGNYPEVMREAYANPTPRIVDVENRHFDSNHAVVGYFVARSWGLSPELCDAIAQHHNLDYITGGDNDQNETQQCLQVLKIAEHIAGLYRVLGDQAVDKEWEQAGQNILVSIGMSEYEYEDVVAQARELGLGEQQYFC